jgi:hypothetical protein
MWVPEILFDGHISGCLVRHCVPLALAACLSHMEVSLALGVCSVVV